MRNKRTLERRLASLENTLRESSREPFTEVERLQRESLYEFLKGAWQVLEPAKPLSSNWHLELISEYLEAVKLGEIQKLLINIAPRSLKSILCSVCFPCWLWLDNPYERFLCLSYSSILANDHNDLRRSLINSLWYKRLCRGAIVLSSGATWGTSQQVKNRVSEFANNYRGQMIARGLDSSVTGIGGDVIICDDPNNPEGIESRKVREREEKRYRDYIFGRRNSPNAKAILIQQRSHRRDISGVTINEISDGDWEILVLPTRSRSHTEIRFPLSDRRVIREPGDFLHPERHGEKEDKEALKTLGSLMYSGRHDQTPIAQEGGIFPRKWHRIAIDKLPDRKQLAISVDSTFGSKSATASFVVVGVWAIAYPNFICLDVWRKRAGFNETKKAIRDIRSKWLRLGDVPVTLIENKANGADIIEDLSAEFPGIIPINPRQSKEARAQAISPYFESGNVWFLSEPDAPWFDELTLEFEEFPTGEDNDQVDMTSQVISYYVHRWRQQANLEGATVSYQ